MKTNITTFQLNKHDFQYLLCLLLGNWFLTPGLLK